MDVIVNAAMSADGKLSSRRREQVRISGDADFDRMDAIRTAVDGVVVGIGTVLADDPSLTVKSPARVDARRGRGDPPHPARVVIDSRGRTPLEATVLGDEADTYVCVSEAAPRSRRDDLAADATVIVAGDERVDLPRAVAGLEDAGLDRLMIEGGGELIFSFLAADLVDELRVFVGPLVIGGRDAPTLADGDGFLEDFPELTLEDVTELDEGVVLSWTVDGTSSV